MGPHHYTSHFGSWIFADRRGLSIRPEFNESSAADFGELYFGLRNDHDHFDWLD